MADVIKVTLVNRVPNSVTVSTGVSGGGTWGTISGTITDQSDLVTYVTSERPNYPVVSPDGTSFIIVAGNDGTLAAIPPNSTAPSITSVPTISGTLNVGETLTATAGDVSGEPTPTRVLQWQRSDNGTTGWADISGATGTTYLLAFNDEDKYIRVAQTEENILGTATANSASTTQIQPAPSTFLLDLYPNAAAAYSLRKLSALYSGDAIRIRRASDNAEAVIGFVGNNLDTASLESFCAGTDGFVTTWYDQSGNGYDAAQGAASNQPQIVSSGSTILVNNKPSFVSDEDFLVNFTKTASSTATMFMVHKGNSDNSSNVSVAGFPANSYSGHIGLYFWEQDSSDPFGFNIWQGDSWGYDNAKTDFDSQSLWTSLFKEGNITTSGVKLFRNGTEKTLSQVRASSTGNRIIDNGVYIGRGGTVQNSQEGDGWYQEIVIWDADYSSTNRSGIETNINNFYNIY